MVRIGNVSLRPGATGQRLSDRRQPRSPVQGLSGLNQRSQGPEVDIAQHGAFLRHRSAEGGGTHALHVEPALGGDEFHQGGEQVLETPMAWRREHDFQHPRSWFRRVAALSCCSCSKRS